MLEGISELEQQYTSLIIKDRQELDVSGKDLMKWKQKEGGPWLKECLELIETAVLTGKVENKKEKIRGWLRILQSKVRQQLLDAFTNSDEEFLSGQYLAELIGCSRTAVWKHMEDLRNEGFELEAVRRKGYRIVKIPEKITANEIRLGLKTERLGQQIHYEETVDSTQKIALRFSMDGAPEGTLSLLKNKHQAGEEWIGNGIRQNIQGFG